MTQQRPVDWILVSVLSLSPLAPALAADAPPSAEDEARDKKKEEERAAKRRAAAGPEDMPAYGEMLVVSASRTEETILDAPVAMSVIGAERLENAPSANLADAVRGTPGLNIIQTSARDFSFTQRGATSTLAAGQLAILDGRSIYQDFYGFVMWDVLPVALDEIEQVEIVRGPASAIWGANAFNGVVNIRSKSPREIQGANAMIGGGEIGTFQSSLRWAAAPNDAWSYKVSGAYFRQDPWERPTTLPSGLPMPSGAAYQNEGTKQPKFNARVDYEPDAESRFSLAGGLAYTSGLIHTGIGPFSVDDSTNLAYGQISYQNQGFDGTFYMNRIDGEATNVINLLPFEFLQTTWAADMTQRVALGSSQTLLFGLSGRTNGFDLSIAPRDDRRNELGGFVEDQIRITDAVRLNLGARLDWFDTIDTVFSPRTSLILKPADNVSFRMSYNRAFRAPSLVNNYLETAVPNIILLPPPVDRPYVFPTAAVGNEELEEERIDAVEVGMTWVLLDDTTLTLSVYRNETKNNIDFYPAEFYGPADPPPGWPLPPAFVPPFTLPKVFTYRNVGKVIDKGVEASANFRLARGVNANISYAFQDDPEIEDDDPRAPLGLNLPPRHSYSLGIDAGNDQWFGSANVQYVDEAFWSDVLDARFWGTTPAYTTINAGLGVHLADRRYTLALNVMNLTDLRYQQHIFGDILARKFTAEARLKF